MIKQPIIRIKVTFSLNSNHDRKTVTTYPIATMGYAQLSSTLDKTTNQDKALMKNRERPKRTKGDRRALSNTIGRVFMLRPINPTLSIPCFKDNWADTAKVMENRIKRKFFTSFLLFLDRNP